MAWKEFLRGKRSRQDVQVFSLDLMDNILQLHSDLAEFIYQHDPYQAFRINDPKPRQIHKASVRDRLLHHAIYRILYPFFDQTFIADSFSCRLNKGTHRALRRFARFDYRVGKNYTRTVWVLQCDIRKFFENIDHGILLAILSKYITDDRIMALLTEVIHSFSVVAGRGLPLGNLTSQLFVNVYMNSFDQFMKHRLKARYYIRYADDFVTMSISKNWLVSLIPEIRKFLSDRLKLELHPDKISIKTIVSGIDFLGWMHFPDHRVLRTTTRRRMFKKLSENKNPERLTSYLGLIRHGNTHKLEAEILKSFSAF